LETAPMTSAERLCLVAARSEALLADFVALFLLRWAMKHFGLEYVYFQPILDDVSPPLALSDLQYPASALFYGSMYFVSGLPELVLAAMWFVYATIALSLFGKTIGMWQSGVALVDKAGGKPGPVRVLIRQIVAPFSSICWIGYWPTGFSAGASTLHDLASGTRIVYARKPREV